MLHEDPPFRRKAADYWLDGEAYTNPRLNEVAAARTNCMSAPATDDGGELRIDRSGQRAEAACVRRPISRSQTSSHSRSVLGQNAGGPSSSSGSLTSHCAHASRAVQLLQVRNAQHNVSPNRGATRHPWSMPRRSIIVSTLAAGAQAAW